MAFQKFSLGNQVKVSCSGHLYNEQTGVVVTTIYASGTLHYDVKFSDGLVVGFRDSELVSPGKFSVGDTVQISRNGASGGDRGKAISDSQLRYDSQYEVIVQWSSGYKSTYLEDDLAIVEYATVDPVNAPPRRKNAYIFDPARHSMSPDKSLSDIDPIEAYVLGVDAAYAIGTSVDPGTLVERYKELIALPEGTVVRVQNKEAPEHNFVAMRVAGERWATFDGERYSDYELWRFTDDRDDDRIVGEIFII